MASDINKVFLIGRLTRDVEFSMTTTGKQLCKFSLAVNGYKDEVSFINCTAWEKTAELINQYVKKGDRVAIDGSLKQSRFEDKDGNKRSAVDVIVNSIQFLTTKQESSQQANSEQNNSNYNKPEDPVKSENIQESFLDDDIPF